MKREIMHHPKNQYCLNNLTCLFVLELKEELEQTETKKEKIERERESTPVTMEY